jgi:hypothetical protein
MFDPMETMRNVVALVVLIAIGAGAFVGAVAFMMAMR